MSADGVPDGYTVSRQRILVNVMLDRKLVSEAAKELKRPLVVSEAGEQRAAAYFVASSLRLEGIASTPKSVLKAAGVRKGAKLRPSA